MKYYKNILKIVALLLFGTLYAQQQPNNVLYRYTMNTINPAYAGADGMTSFTSHFRSQWGGVQGAPETQTFFFAKPFSEKVGLGISVVNDKIFIENTTRFNIDFSYKLKLTETTNLFLGIKAGGATYNLDRGDLANLDFPQDQALANVDTGFRPNVGLGAYLVNDKYFVSLSIPSLLLSERINTQDGRITYATEKTHAFLSGGYNYTVNDEVELRPSAMVRYVSGAPLSADITAAVRYMKRFEAGVMYRTDSAFAGFLMLELADWVNLGYAYEGSSVGELTSVSNGTHEVFIRFNFNNSKAN